MGDTSGRTNVNVYTTLFLDFQLLSLAVYSYWCSRIAPGCILLGKAGVGQTKPFSSFIHSGGA